MSRAPTSAPRSKRKLGELLREAGLIDDSHLSAALHEQKKWGGRLGRTLVEMGFVTEASMCAVLAQQLQLQTIDLDTATLPDRVETTLRLDLAERYGVFPVAFDATTKQLALATSDPTNLESLQEIEFATGHKLLPVVATASAIDRAIRRYYFGEQATGKAVSPPPTQVVSETSYELDQLLGSAPAQGQQSSGAGNGERLEQEVLALREQVQGLEQIVSSQVRATRTMVELLFEYGLVSREDYLQKLNKPQ